RCNAFTTGTVPSYSCLPSAVIVATIAWSAENKDILPDVSEAEWTAAIPLKGSGIPMPKQIKGPKRTEPPRSPQEGTVYATVAVVIRADGTQGVYRVVATNDREFAAAYVKKLRQQRFEPPMKDGAAVAVRGEATEQVTVQKGGITRYP